jgi:hypothetical protein
MVPAWASLGWWDATAAAGGHKCASAAARRAGGPAEQGAGHAGTPRGMSMLSGGAHAQQAACLDQGSWHTQRR